MLSDYASTIKDTAPALEHCPPGCDLWKLQQPSPPALWKWLNFSITPLQNQRWGNGAEQCWITWCVQGRKRKTLVWNNWHSDKPAAGPQGSLPVFFRCQEPCQSQGTPLPTTTRENSNTNLNFSAYFYGFRGKLVICFEGCKVYTQTEVFQEAQQAAVAKAFLPPCLLNATESEKARHKIRLSIKTIPLLNSLSSPRSTSISKITYDHKQQDCNIQVPG